MPPTWGNSGHPGSEGPPYQLLPQTGSSCTISSLGLSYKILFLLSSNILMSLRQILSMGRLAWSLSAFQIPLDSKEQSPLWEWECSHSQACLSGSCLPHKASRSCCQVYPINNGLGTTTQASPASGGPISNLQVHSPTTVPLLGSLPLLTSPVIQYMALSPAWPKKKKLQHSCYPQRVYNLAELLRNCIGNHSTKNKW